MLRPLSASLALAASTLLATPAQSPTTAAINADVWSAVAASVVHDDIAAMGRTYHPDAVLVSEGGTRSIATALAGWGKGMVDNKAKGIHATVEFRFTKRQDDAETAFETGVFKYTLIDKAGVITPSYRRLEALLVKRQGKWRILMERQLDAVTEAEWNAIPRDTTLPPA
ncbi:MAG: nuclear transport factor 2 family protein [Chloroflexia bacterium]